MEGAETHQTVGISNQEHTNEDGNSIPSRDLLAQCLNARHTGRLAPNDGCSSPILVFRRVLYQSAVFTGRDVFFRHAARQWIASHASGCN